MIRILGQSIESGDEAGARQLFDVFETLLILVRFHFSFCRLGLICEMSCRKYQSLAHILQSWHHSSFKLVETAISTLKSAFWPSTPLTGLCNSEIVFESILRTCLF